MSVGIATMGMFINPTNTISPDHSNTGGPGMYEFGGGFVGPGGETSQRKRLKVTVRMVNSFNEKVKIKAQLSDD
jgi:hypothetical protein